MLSKLAQNLCCILNLESVRLVAANAKGQMSVLEMKYVSVHMKCRLHSWSTNVAALNLPLTLSSWPAPRCSLIGSDSLCPPVFLLSDS